MTESKRKGPIYDPGLCRCCGSVKKCRLLNVEYEWSGQKEIYSEMFVDCFGLMLSHLDGAPTERLVCATCVLRLRDACAFRQQVLHCEDKLLKSKIKVHDSAIKFELDIKEEVNESFPDDHYEDIINYSDHDDSDLEPLQKHKLKKSMKMLTGKEKKSKDCVKKVKKTIKNKVKDDEVRFKKRMLIKMKKLSEKLKNMENTDYHRSELPEETPIDPQTKIIDDEQKAFVNTVTIVETSFVCPFDTSFSDYYCIYCREVFTDPSKLRDHTSQHDPNTFKDIVSNTNKKIILVDVARIDCRLCSEKIVDLDVFKEHIANYHGKLIYDTRNEFVKFRLTINNLTCTECSSTFSFFHALKKHMAEHFGSCICDICGAHYFEERMLILHQKSHQKRVDENFPCQDCGKNFKSKHSRYLHVSKLHAKEPAYQCSKCDEVLFSYALRYRHMIEIHGEKRLFPCEHCDRAYDSRKSLREHNRRNHLKIFKHQCDLCEKRFYLPSRLKEHLVTHTGERNYRCEYCGKSYPRLRGLKVHMQSHSSEKKYRCNMCSASFTQNVNLKNHIKRQHQSMDIEEGFHE